MPREPAARQAVSFRGATLAGVSIDYYTRLERGKETRPARPSSMLSARALNWSSDEHEHLRALAARAARYAPEPAAAPARPSSMLSPAP